MSISEGISGISEVDSELSDTSERPLMNKVIKSELDGKVGKTEFSNFTDNIVTSVNENSTNSQYPTAGAVWSAILSGRVASGDVDNVVQNVDNKDY